jgi:hypothetical protein
MTRKRGGTMRIKVSEWNKYSHEERFWILEHLAFTQYTKRKYR